MGSSHSSQQRRIDKYLSLNMILKIAVDEYHCNTTPFSFSELLLNKDYLYKKYENCSIIFAEHVIRAVRYRRFGAAVFILEHFNVHLGTISETIFCYFKHNENFYAQHKYLTLVEYCCEKRRDNEYFFYNLLKQLTNGLDFSLFDWNTKLSPRCQTIVKDHLQRLKFIFQSTTTLVDDTIHIVLLYLNFKFV